VAAVDFDLDDTLEPDITDLPDGVRVAHLSDTHIGYEAYRVLASTGDNQRGVDIIRAFVRACDDIVAWDPPLVVHSGDIAERPQIPVRHLLLIRQQLTKLASVRPDGTRRQVVVIAGNHDLPSQRREACFLELFRDLPGVHIVTDTVRRVEFTDAGQPGGAAPELGALTVTCIPHDTLKDLAVEGGFDDIAPAQSRMNILVAHGVAGGSGLYRRVLGREYAIPTEVLARGWDYGALGHWHRQGPIPLAATSASDGRGRVWYAGSSENMGFGDLLDNGGQRGWLRVTLNPGAVPDVERAVVPNRAMLRLPVLEGAGLDPATIETELRSRVADAAAAGRIAGAVVGQIVRGVPREVWSLVDLTQTRDAASPALHYEVGVDPVRRTVTEDDGRTTDAASPVAGLAEVRAALNEVAATALADQPAERRSAVLALASDLLGHEMASVVDTDDIADADTTTAGDGAADTSSPDAATGTVTPGTAAVGTRRANGSGRRHGGTSSGAGSAVPGPRGTVGDMNEEVTR
jgi:DNA repair exonuclease SbcCD nuclease subunit